MKIIDVLGWSEVEKAMDTLAKRKDEWFPQGFNGIHAVSNPEFFAAMREGAVYFSNADELVKGFNPAKQLTSAIEKINNGVSLSFDEEYAIETVWHELMHGITGIKATKNIIDKDPFEEGFIQMAARFSYPNLLTELGGSEKHQETIITNGYAYPNTARNLIEMVRMAGMGIDEVSSQIIEHGLNSRDILAGRLSQGLNIKQGRIATLYGHAIGKPLSDFIEKVKVLAKHAPRNSP